MSKESKLVELRRKTDRDLMILVQRELDRGLALAHVASTKESPLYGQAKEVHEIVNAWLPLIIGLEPDDVANWNSDSENFGWRWTDYHLKGCSDISPVLQRLCELRVFRFGLAC